MQLGIKYFALNSFESSTARTIVKSIDLPPNLATRL